MEATRANSRLPAMDIMGQVRSKRGLFKGKWRKVRVVSFSGSSVAATAQFPLERTDRVELALMLTMEVGDIVVDRINATVTEARFRNGEVCIELEYDTEQDSMARQGLLRLERIWSQFNRLNDRLNEKSATNRLFNQLQ